LFQKRSYLKLSGIIFGFEVLVLLPLYLWAKLSIEGPSEISSPLLSPIHRMIVNPLLMIVLIAALYYQQYMTSKAK
jgi:exosortase F-associated protein